MELDFVQLLTLVIIACVVIYVFQALMRGAGVVIGIIIVLIMFGGYSLTQLRDDAGKALDKGRQVACPEDVAVQLRAARVRHMKVQAALKRTDISPTRRDELSVEAGTLKATIVRLEACMRS